MKFYVYILFSEGHDKFYVGQTNNVEARLKRHNSGRSKYTKPYIPWLMICSIEKESRAQAMELERKLKNLSKDRLKKFAEKYR